VPAAIGFEIDCDSTSIVCVVPARGVRWAGLMIGLWLLLVVWVAAAGLLLLLPLLLPFTGDVPAPTAMTSGRQWSPPPSDIRSDDGRELLRESEGVRWAPLSYLVFMSGVVGGVENTSWSGRGDWIIMMQLKQNRDRRAQRGESGKRKSWGKNLRVIFEFVATKTSLNYYVCCLGNNTPWERNVNGRRAMRNASTILRPAVIDKLRRL
jgi:hypothetical protein